MPDRAHTPADFSAILAGPEPPLVVGGQAVNVWAELYAATVSALAEFEPFVSEDADIFGSRTLACELAARAGWECHFPDRGDSVVVAVLTGPRAAGDPPRVVGVLGEVNGLTESDLAISSLVELHNGQRYRVLSPLILLKAKLYNLISLVNLDRPQDLRQARVLLELVPYFLKEHAAEVQAGRMPERDLLGALHYLAELIRLPWVGNAVRAHGLDLRSMFPPWLREACPDATRSALDEIAASA